MVVRSNKIKSSRRSVERQRFTVSGEWNYAGQQTFGSRLRAERARKRYSRNALAVTTGIREKRLVDIEFGKEMPSFKDIRAIATALDIPESELMAAGHLKQE